MFPTKKNKTYQIRLKGCWMDAKYIGRDKWHFIFTIGTSECRHAVWILDADIEIRDEYGVEAYCAWDNIEFWLIITAAGVMVTFGVMFAGWWLINGLLKSLEGL